MFYFARCMNIIFNSQLVKYDVHTTRKIKSIQAILSHIIIILQTVSSVLWEFHQICNLGAVLNNTESFRF